MHNNPYASFGQEGSVAGASEQARTEFIRRTYSHLAGAVLLFIALEALAFALTTPEQRWDVVRLMMGSRWSWLLVLGAFMGVSWIANSWANSSTQLSTQYLGLATYVVAEAIIFLPLLFLAHRFAPEAITTAAMITIVVFGGLTGFVFVTKTDLSGWGKYLCMASFGALGFILLGMFMPGIFGLGGIFTALMIMLASGYILYETSNVLHQYNTTQYVAASLALFASVALLFWYVLRLVMSLSND